MKISFSEKITFVPEWKGNDKLPEDEQIKVTLKVMTMSDLLTVMDMFQASGLSGEVDAAKVDVEKTKKVLAGAKEILPKYAEITNLELDTGFASIETVVHYGTFTRLAMEILLKLAQISTPNEEEQGN
jgi:hypothetical protein